MNETVRALLEEKIVAIVRGVASDRLEAAARALLEGGVRCIEITFNQSDPASWTETQRGISLLRDRVDGLLVGAGTVTTPQLVHLAVDAGAGYIISPDMNPAVIAATKERGAVSIPGCMTPTEAMTAHAGGADIIKLFPAGVLGPAYLRALCEPLSHLRFFAVGGVTPANLPDFLAAGAGGVGVGGSLVDKKAVAAGNYDRLTALAREFAGAAGRGKA